MSLESSALHWTKWQPIDVVSRNGGPAVYRIRAVKNGRPLVIDRFLGTDVRGILSIGVSGNFEQRRQKFVRALSVGRGHSEANLLCLLFRYCRLEQKIGNILIEYSCCAQCLRSEALKLEAQQIKNYLRRYGEVPPLNSAIPERYTPAW